MGDPKAPSTSRSGGFDPGDKAAFQLALLSLFVLGFCIIVINSYMKTKLDVFSNQIVEALWKLRTKFTQEEQDAYDKWSFRKLVLAGLMAASLIVSVSVRVIGRVRAVTYAAVFTFMWTIFTTWFWFNRKFEDDDETDEASSITGHKKEAASGSTGWAKRVKAGSAKDGDPRLPITIITGFLGSGKTTLIKRILNNTVGMKILVVENEIGEEGVDHELLMQHTKKEEIILMNNGCVCCTVRKDLLGVFHKLFADDAFAKLEWVVIETTGLADPAPLIQSLYMDDKCRAVLRLDAVVTVVDSKHLPIHLRTKNEGKKGAHGGIPEAVQQIAYADRVLMNKIDLVSVDELAEVTSQVLNINESVKILQCEQSVVPLEDILGIRAFDVTKNKALIEPIQTETPKSFLPIDKNGKIIVTKKRVVNVATAAGSSEAAAVVTASLTCDDPMDLHNVSLFIGKVLREKGETLYRLKGILSMQGYDRQFVAHGIHMLFDGELGPEWPTDRKRSSKLVLIGLDLDPGALQEEFLKCRVAGIAKS